MAHVNRTSPATHGLLATLHADWAARGWDPAVLNSFRMEGEGGEGEGGEGSGGGQGGAASSPPAATPPATPPAQTGGAPDLTGLQAALDAATGSARTEALAPLMAAIGVDSPEALQTWVTERQAEIDAGKDEATRAREAAERQASEARAETAQARAEAHEARIDAALAIAGAPQANVSDLRRLVDVPADTPADQYATAVTTAVEAVKTKYPAMFGAPTPGAPHSVPGQPGKPAPPDELEEARERGRKYREHRTNTAASDPFAKFRKIG